MRILKRNEILALLESTRKNSWSILAANIFDLVGVDAAVYASSEKKIPVLVQSSYKAIKLIGDGDFDLGLNLISKHLEAYTEHKDSAELIFGLDHFSVNDVSDETEFFEVLKHALQVPQLSYVMVDASALSFDENIRISAKAVSLIKSADKIAEAEINATPGKEDGNQFDNSSLAVDMISEFLEKVDPDTVGFDLGLLHGSHGLKKRDINWEMINQFYKISDRHFFVLHGGSSAKESDLKKGRGLFSKVNISGIFKEAVYEELKTLICAKEKNSSPESTRFAAREVLKKETLKYLEILSA